MSGHKNCDLKLIEEKWKALNLPIQQFNLVVQLGGFRGEVQWIKFMPVTCSTISSVIIICKDSNRNLYLIYNVLKDLTETLTKVCEILSLDPPGANARIKFDVFKEIYLYLITQVEKSTSPRYADGVLNYLQTEWA